ncbi:Ser/Thr phosphatase family protein [Candidatus Scalindua japonica]|uniref:Ser/Thr phosphatase family protein n=1 Tax=Candidatus Scalindua japonica TaxID=1284222 RepID=A0A286TXX6_9BACT|nr:metallophosphoesterase [Candidatus Scalindua japonica]GAX60671.1 Ser/Thr phosphatase family protein [Candidatus Scalindua japonica]
MNQTLTQSENSIVILHLSDLHFDGNDNCQDSIDRQGVFGTLIDEIKSLDEEWRPNIVCITGDVAYQNKQSGYEASIEWLNTLLHELAIEKEGVFFCPGNHDVNRVKASFLVRPDKVKDADRILSLPIADHFKSLFARYEEFCKTLSLPAYCFNGSQEYIVGKRSYKDINFVCNNSCWCSMDEDDKGSLWLGLNFIKSLGLPEISNPRFPITIALFHHPKEYYNESETNRYGNRESTIDYLSSRCHIILTGHTHGRPRKPDIIHDNAIKFSGGCYISDQYRNSCSLIRLWPERMCIDYRQYEWDGGQSRWTKFYEELDYKLRIIEKFKNPDYQPAREVQQGIEAEAEREHSLKEIEEIHKTIFDHITSLDNTKAIDHYEKNLNVIDAHRDKYKETIKQIELLILEAKDGRT